MDSLGDSVGVREHSKGPSSVIWMVTSFYFMHLLGTECDFL